MNKKFWMIPCVVLLVIMLAVPVFGTTGPVTELTVEGAVGAAGSTATLFVKVPKGFVDSMSAVIEYDEGILQLTDSSAWLVTEDVDLSDISVKNESQEQGRVANFAVWAATKARYVSDNVLKLVFSISQDAQLETSYPVTVTFSTALNQTFLMEQETVQSAITVKAGVAVGGTVTAAGDEDAPATVALLKAEGDGLVAVGQPVTTDENGAYTFPAVDPGDYVLRFSKTKHAPRDYAITVGGEEVTCDGTIYLYGDVTRDGYVDSTDAGQILLHDAGEVTQFNNPTLDAQTIEYLLVVGDASGDGYVDSTDAGQILLHDAGEPSMLDLWN